MHAYVTQFLKIHAISSTANCEVLTIRILKPCSHEAILCMCNMASCEQMWSSANGEDLRWHIIWQREGLGYSAEIRVAKNLNIDKSTVYRIVHVF